MRFDDVCLILELCVEINVIMIEGMYKYLLMNIAHTYSFSDCHKGKSLMCDCCCAVAATE